MARLAFLALAALSCTSADPFPCSPSSASTPPPVAVGVTGRQVTVRLELDSGVVCPRGIALPTEVVVEVVDARGLVVPSTAGPVMDSGGDGYSVQVTFLPTTEGLHLATARFEPGLGLAQAIVQVALDRTGEAPLAVIRPQVPCIAVEEIGATVVCRGSDVVEVFRASASVQAFAARNMSAAGAVLWTWKDGVVARWEDTGAGPLSGVAVDAGVPDVRGPGHVATAQELFVLSGSTVVGARLEGSSLVASPARDVPVAPPSPSSGVVLVGPGQLGYATAAASLCVVRLEPPAAACTPVELDVFAADGDSLWTRGVETRELGLLRFVSPVGPSVSFFPARPEGLVDTGTPVPIFTWENRLMVPRVRDFALEAWQVPGVTPVRWGATSRVVWVEHPSGSVSVFRRSR